MQGGTPAAVPDGASPKRKGLALSNEELVQQFFERFRCVPFKGGDWREDSDGTKTRDETGCGLIRKTPGRVRGTHT